MKKLYGYTNLHLIKVLISSFFFAIFFSLSSCCFTTTKGPKFFEGNKLIQYNSNWVRKWTDNYWTKHPQYVIELEYKPRKKTIGSEPMYARLPLKYKIAIKKGTFKYFGSFDSEESFKTKASELPKEFYKNDFKIIALKSKNGIRKVYINSKFLY